MKYSFLILIPCLVGCLPTAEKIKGVGDFRNALESEIKTAEGIAEAVRLEIEISQQSRKYVDGWLSYRQGSNGNCATNFVNELRISNTRKANFEILNAYLKGIVQDFEEPSPFSAAAGAANAVPGILKVLKIGSEAAGVAGEAVVSSLIAIGETAYEQHKLFHIAMKAKGLHKAFAETVRDISTGLKTLEAATNANIKLWEDCEYEKLIIMRNSQLNSSAVELEKRFSEFLRQKNSMRNNVQDTKDVEKKANDLVEAHAALFSGKLDIKDLRNQASAVKNIYDEFNKIIVNGDKFSSSISKN